MELIKTNSVQVQPVCKQPVIGDTEKLKQAVLVTKISNTPLEFIRETLRLTMVMVGLRQNNWPVGEEKELLLNHVIETYPNHTCSEIKLAFEMAIAGKLDVDVNCYENFSCLYFSSIMNAFRKWAKDEIKFIPMKEQKLLPEDTTPFTNEERVETDKFLYRTTKSYRAITQKVAAILFKQGKIQKPADEDVKKIRLQAIHDLHEELREEKRTMSQEQKDREVKKIMNQILVAKYFNECK